MNAHKRSIHKSLLLTFVFTGLLFTNPASAWFFFWIPGSVTGKIADALTGSEGENCVGSSAKVGDSIRMPDGSISIVKSLSGTSYRCTQSSHPVRALLEPTGKSELASETPTTQAKIDIPDGWEQQPITEQLRASRTVLYVMNKTIGTGLLLTSQKRSSVTNVETYVNSIRNSERDRLDNAELSELRKVSVNGIDTLQYEVSGNLRTGAKAKLKYLKVFYDGDDEILLISCWATESNYNSHRETLMKLSHSVTGIKKQVVSQNSMEGLQTLKEPTNPAQSSDADTTRRLREIKRMLDEGLINQRDYDNKKTEILKAM